MGHVDETARRERVAVTAVFLVNGALFSSLFARLPAIKADLALGDGALGAILLLGAVGLLAAQLVAGGAIERAGAPWAMRVSAPAYAAAIVLAALAPSPLWLALAFLAVGAANGVLDVAMNAEGAALERRLSRPVMSSFHAAFSFGALAGAGLGALAAVAGLTPLANLAPVAAAGAVVALAAIARLSSAASPRADSAPLVARPTRAVAALGALAFCVLLAEGSVADWSAIYLRETLAASQAAAAAGLAVFSLTMGIGRLAGDRLVAALGPRPVATTGLVLATGGLAVVVAAGAPAVAIAGFALVGIGLSTVFPLVVSAAARRPELPPGPAIAAVASAGYAGFLVGPPAIGLVAELVELRAALLLPALLCLGALALAGALAASPGRPARQQ